jgi:NTP pyrophosphatase (non-canonical NTP hydrolase)
MTMTSKEVSSINMFASSLMGATDQGMQERVIKAVEPYAIGNRPLAEVLAATRSHLHLGTEKMLDLLAKRIRPPVKEFVRACRASKNIRVQRLLRKGLEQEAAGQITPLDMSTLAPDDEVNTTRFEQEVERTAASLTMQDLPILCLGLAGESGEVCDIVKKVFGHKHKWTPEVERDVIEELGDLLWYITATCRVLGVTLDELMTRNVAKLRKRYPEGWDPKRSENRKEDDVQENG